MHTKTHNKGKHTHRLVGGVAGQHEHETGDAHEDRQAQTAQIQQRPVAALREIDQRVGDQGNGGKEEQPRAQQLVVLEVIPTVQCIV